MVKELDVMVKEMDVVVKRLVLMVKEMDVMVKRLDVYGEKIGLDGEKIGLDGEKKYSFLCFFSPSNIFFDIINIKEMINMEQKNDNDVYIVSEKEIETVAHNIVVANSLIEANHNLVLNENKLLNAVIAQIGMHDNEIRKFEFSTKQLQEICNLKPLHIQRTLRTIKKNLMGKTFTLKDTIENNGKSESAATDYHWIDKITYNDNKWIITLSNDLAPLLLNLKKEFTTKRLNQIQSYDNVYAQRLDMIFTMYFNRKTSKMSLENKLEYQGKIYYSIEELKKMFQLELKYTDFVNFNRYILSPAIQEINSKDFFVVEMEKKIGKNKKCQGIFFYYKLGEKSQKEFINKINNNNEKGNKDKIKQVLNSFGFSKKEILLILSKISEKELNEFFSLLAKKQENSSEEEKLKEEELIDYVKNGINQLLEKKNREESLKAFL